MRIRLAAAILAIGALATVGHSAAAQTRNTHLGPRLIYDFDFEEFGVGAQLSVPIARNLEFYPSFDYFFVDPGSVMQFNVDLKYRVPADFDWLYVGAGANITRIEFGDTDHHDTNLNLFGGYESLRGRVHPFVEVRVIAGNGSRAQIAGGLNFTI